MAVLGVCRSQGINGILKEGVDENLGPLTVYGRAPVRYRELYKKGDGGVGTAQNQTLGA